MPISKVICVVVTCDDCGDGWQDNDDYGTPHWPVGDATAEADFAQLLDSKDDGGLGWTEDDGVLRCRSCTSKHKGTTREHRSCARCGKYEQRGVPGACETLPPPVELSRAAQLVQWRRNHDLYIAAGHSPGDGRIGDEDLAMEVRALIFEAVALVERVDTALDGGAA